MDRYKSLFLFLLFTIFSVFSNFNCSCESSSSKKIKDLRIPGTDVDFPTVDGDIVTGTLVDMDLDGISDGVDFDDDGKGDIVFTKKPSKIEAIVQLNRNDTLIQKVELTDNRAKIINSSDNSTILLATDSTGTVKYADINGDRKADVSVLATTQTIDSFSFDTVSNPSLSTASTGTIDYAPMDTKTITMTVPAGTNMTALKPSFVSGGMVVRKRDTSTIENGTDFDFSSPVTLEIENKKGSLQNYQITVNVETTDPTTTTTEIKIEGVLDTTFNGQGYAYESSNSEGKAATLDSSNNIYVTGTKTSTASLMTTWKYTSSGSLDTTFGSSGTVQDSNSGRTGNKIDTDSSGNIYAGGYDSSLGYLWKISNAGSISNTYSFGSRSSYGFYMSKINNNIYMTNQSANSYFEVYKFDRSSPSTPAALYSGTQYDVGYGLYEDSSGKLYISGTANYSSFDMLLIKLTKGITGGYTATRITPFDRNSGNDGGNAITVDSNGRILIAGYTTSGSYKDMTVWRYNSDCSLDTTFNSTGYRYINASTYNDEATSIVIGPDGKIYIAGLNYKGMDNVQPRMTIYCINNDGSLNTSFGTNGLYEFPSVDSAANSLIFDSNNNLIVTGYSKPAQAKVMTIWKLK